MPGIRVKPSLSQSESNDFKDPAEVRRIEHQVAHEVVAEVDVRPRNVVVPGPGTIPKTLSGGCAAPTRWPWSPSRELTPSVRVGTPLRDADAHARVETD